MTTKTLLFGILALMLALSVNAQTESNPKLVDTYRSEDGPILVVDVFDIIQTSGFTIRDLKTMRESIEELEEMTEQQDKSIIKQEEKLKQDNNEINLLKKEIKDMKSDYQDLLRDLKLLQKQLDEMKRKLP